MEIVKLNEIEYINCDDVFKKAPIYCKDSRNGRELIKNESLKIINKTNITSTNGVTFISLIGSRFRDLLF
jgi:hypothetical protein